MKKLHISPNLALPLDAITSTLVVYGGKGMGKTNFGGVLIEEMAKCGQRFSIIDPMGVWWGIQHGADKSTPGVECLLLGGIHGDIPIEPTAGAIVADLVVDENANVIIDISRRPNGTMWSIGERVRFVRDYCQRLYQRQGEKRRPLMQGIDEAARFIPQIIRKDDADVAACMGAIAVLVEEGRNVGVGVCLITQRSARLNKDVAELADCMIAFRTVGPNSRRAVLDWLGEHVEKERLKDLDQKVRSLPRGHALVVSPGWLEFEGVVPIRIRETFDSSATPKVGKQLHAPGKARKPDLDLYRRRMAETIERAKADDPKELRKQIAELQRQLKVRPTAAPAKAERTEVPVLKEIDRKWLHHSFNEMRIKLAETRDSNRRAVNVYESMEKDFKTFEKGIARIAEAIERKTGKSPALAVTVHAHQPMAPRTARAIGDMARVAVKAVSDGSISRPQQRILDALASFEAMGVQRVRRVLAAFYSGASPRSSTYTNNLGALRTRGLIVYPDSDHLMLTDAGKQAADVAQTFATNEALHQAWMTKLPRPQTEILKKVIEIYPDDIEKEKLAQAAGASATSSTYTNNLGALRSLGAIDYPDKGRVRATELLFPFGA